MDANQEFEMVEDLAESSGFILVHIDDDDETPWELRGWGKSIDFSCLREVAMFLMGFGVGGGVMLKSFNTVVRSCGVLLDEDAEGVKTLACVKLLAMHYKNDTNKEMFSNN
jgi:hypothetical protein